MKKNLKKGFTLLEMVIVILIISILFLLAVPNIRKTMDVVNSKGCKAMEKVGDAAILQYKLENGDYPSSVSELVSAGFLTEDQITCDGDHQMTIVDGRAAVE